MEFAFNLLTKLHVLAGFASLLLFWIPVVARKGGSWHKRAGQYYVRSMWCVAVTAFLLSIKNLNEGNTLIAVFLGFLAVITAKPLWLGLAILRNKSVQSMAFRYLGIVINGAVVLSGLALIIYGIGLQDQNTAIFLYVFGGIGVTSVFDLVSIVKRGPRSKQWLKLHIVSMGTSGIAAHTAFLAFGATRFIADLLLGYWVLVLWLAPTLIGALAIHLAVRRFTKGKPSAPASSSPQTQSMNTLGDHHA